MLIIRKNEINNPIATVSMNKTLSNPYYLFSFQHIASKERVSFIPQVITSNCRYDKFRFIEGPTTNLVQVPPVVYFPYLGQYYYSIYEQVTSGNTNPALAYNKLESGRAIVIVGNDNTEECFFEPYISDDENFANVIYVSEEEQECIDAVTATVTPTLTSTPTLTPSSTPCFGYQICFVSSGATFEDLCSNPQPVPCLYSPQPFFTNEQQLYRDACLTQFIDWNDGENALFLSTGGTQQYFYGYATFGLSTYGFTCPSPSPTPTLTSTPTLTPTNTPTVTPTPS
jgi:hypothetical protein